MCEVGHPMIVCQAAVAAQCKGWTEKQASHIAWFMWGLMADIVSDSAAWRCEQICMIGLLPLVSCTMFGSFQVLWPSVSLCLLLVFAEEELCTW